MKIKKPRHNPNKIQNQAGGDYSCLNYDIHGNGKEFCHDHTLSIDWDKKINDKLVCKGNPHSCLKNKYKFLASLSNKERQKYINKNFEKEIT